SERDSGSEMISSLALINQAERRGLRFFGRTSDHLDRPGIGLHQTLGCGGGTIDFDLDGWSDLYLLAAGGTPPHRDSAPNLLARNLAGNFQDVTSVSGSGDTGFGQGVAVGDVNQDGFPDLLVLNYGPNTLLINNGDGTFSDVSDRLGVNGDHWSTSGAIADLDGDQLADLVIVNYCAGLEPVTKTCPMSGSEETRSCTPVMFPSELDFFLKTAADGSFVDHTKTWSAIPNVPGRGLGIVAGAFDNRPGVDVFVANDMTNNHFWSRARESRAGESRAGESRAGESRAGESRAGDGGPFQLQESAIVLGLGADDRSLAQGSMGIATGDFDLDGDIDFYVTNFDKEYNTYHEQRGAGIWQDRTSVLGLSTPTLPLVGFGTEAVDLDNDGTLELVVTNGHVDIFSRAGQRSVYAQPLQVFHRRASGAFAPLGDTLLGDYGSSPHVGRALWTLDANRDGRVDLVVTHQTEPVALLINESGSPGNWLALRLVGRNCDRDAVGARVQVTAGDRHLTAVKTSGDGYLCSNEKWLRFGLGVQNFTISVKIQWPDGTLEDYAGLSANQELVIVQGEAPFPLRLPQ
ncbi:MAG: CRTAC1 family protein, partial [Pirellulales bacterium]|nr:CRTAC1 family protein [Pirellulales bacterium]